MITHEDIKTFEEYQEEAWKTAKESAKNVGYMFSGLGGEVGEVLSLYAKAIRDGASYEEYHSNIKKELGDVLWFVSGLAQMFNMTLLDVAKANIEKLQSRVQRGTIEGSGDDR